MDQAVLRRRMAKSEMPPTIASGTMAGSGTHSSPYAFRKSSRLMPD
jgi:hypothetical protein